MGQSLVKNYLHIIFSTKNRQPLILPEVEENLYKYLGGVCRNLESPSLIVGGHIDHVHILCLLSKKLALITLLEQVKTESSKWMKLQSPTLKNFYWQDGYGAFSVNPYQVDIIRNYILNQKEHHKKITFKDEYRKFLKKYKVEYDERYVWD
jgi:putative transposase